MSDTRHNKNVHYFPSYEIVTGLFSDPWSPDRRHVNRQTIDVIMRTFMRHYALDWNVGRPAFEPLAIVARMAQGVDEASRTRLANRLRVLAAEPSVSVQIISDTIVPDLPPGTAGICILHRPGLDGEAELGLRRHLLAKGYVIVSEFDVGPDAGSALQATDELALLGAHAVQTNTQSLADLLRSKNPEIAIFPDAMPALPRIVNFSDPDRRTLFLDGFDQSQDWAPLLPALNAAAASVGERLSFSVVHDRALFDALDTPHKSFVPACDHETYLRLLGRSEIAFLPMADTPSNRTRSDLRFIEAAACRVAALASTVVYGATIEHGRTGLMFRTPQELLQQLVWLVVNPRAVALADAGRNWVSEHRMLASQTTARLAWYHSLLARRLELTTLLHGRVPELGGTRPTAV